VPSDEIVSASAGALSGRSRFGIAGGVLLAEYLAVSLRFDALGVADRGGVWSWVGRLGAIAPLAVVVATTLVLLRSRKNPWADIEFAKPNRVLLGLHVLLYAGLFTVTGRVFGTEEAPSGSAAAWLVLLAFLAVGTALSLLVGLIGPSIVARAASWSALLAVGIGVLAWVAGQFTTELWTVVSRLTLTVVAAMLRAFGFDAQIELESHRLALGEFEVFVSGECSGLEGVGLAAVLLGAYLIAFRERLRMPNALLLLPLGLLVVWLGNAIRIAILTLVGEYVDGDLAYGGFHSKLGWVLFCAVTLGIAALAQRASFFRMPSEDDGKREQFENPTAGYLMPALVLNATALVTAMFAREIDRFYGLRLLAAGAALVAYRRYYRDLPRTGSLVAVAVGLAVGAAWVASTPSGEFVPVQAHWSWIVTRAVGSVLFVPIVEELAFRGCLMRWLVARDFTSVPLTKWSPWAVIGSSLAFGLLHDRWVAATLVGVVYAYLQVRRGSIVDAILAHAATNAAVTVSVLWTGNLALWS
jgi:exosortase E/protease (VPEID-CTERM system)